MRHLINDSIYSPKGEELLPLEGCDGTELLTGYVPVEHRFFHDAVSVHLPYCTDWYSVWKGRMKVHDSLSDEDARFIFYGRDREEIIESMRLSIDLASVLRPLYGVIHAGSANFDELLSKRYTDSDDEVLKAFAEAINSAVSSFPKGEPPFRLLFENQWWPGLRMLDGKNYRTLCNELEFENWGLCLDTGHLLVTTQDSRDERQAIELLSDILNDYPQDMKDSISTMHFHVNTTADIISESIPDPDFMKMSINDRLTLGYKHVCGIDTHSPFSMKEAVSLTEIIQPDTVTHEMGAYDLDAKKRDFIQQRSLFGIA